MKRQSALERAADTPITWAVMIFYLTIALLTFPDTEAAETWQRDLFLRPFLVADGEPWRLVSYAFVHGGLLHLLLNGMALAWIGPQLESALGSIRFAILYIVSAIGGGLCVGLTNEPYQIVVGGSGALFGMMGAAVALHARAGNSMLDFMSHQGPRSLLSIIALNLVFGIVVPVVSNAGHIGGLIAGFLLTFAWFRFGHWQPRLRVRIAVAVAFAGLCLQAACPVARWDWLMARALDSTDPTVQGAHLEAAALQVHKGLSLSDMRDAVETLRR